MGGESPNIEELLDSGRVRFVINTPTKGRDSARDGFRIRRLAVERRIPCFTSLDTAKVMLQSIKLNKTDKDLGLFNLSSIGKKP